MMVASPHTYHRLPGRRRRIGVLWTAARYSLWLGADHLLQVENRFCIEEYRRFYYRDIQMLMVRRSRHRMVWNILFALLGASGVGVCLQAGEVAGQLMGAAIVVGFLLALLGNTLLGPTCVCHLRTAVQTVALPSLNRLRYVDKALALLQPLLVQAQGEVAPDALASGLAYVEARAAAPLDARQRLSSTATTLRPFHRTRHVLLFGLLLLDGGLTLLTFLEHALFVVFAVWGGMLGIFVTLVLALVGQQQSACPPRVRWLTWAVSIYLGLLYIARTAPMTMRSLNTADLVAGESFGEIMQSLLVHSPWQSSYVYATSLLALAGSLGLGILGWCFLFLEKPQRSVPPPIRLASTPVVEE